MFEAKLIKDSINVGNRLTTIQVTHPRIIHSEFMTHGMFAKNASSSRAIPFKKMVQKVLDDPFIPEKFGVNQSGMQAFNHLSGLRHDLAVKKWLEARDQAVRIATDMAAEKCPVCGGKGDWINFVNELDGNTTTITECPECNGDGLGLNVHKQIVNRLIEPWSWITVCVTGDSGAWSNYFSLRCHPDAQPEIAKQAYMAQRLYFTNTPDDVHTGHWHTPYIQDGEIGDIAKWLGDKAGGWAPSHTHLFETINKISIGRCARTSYLTQEGTRDFQKDIELHDRLRNHKPLHASPFEHVCEAMGDENRYAKYIGWRAIRHTIPNEYVTDFKPNWEQYFK